MLKIYNNMWIIWRIWPDMGVDRQTHQQALLLIPTRDHIVRDIAPHYGICIKQT
jgi:hypothetical protein